MEQNKQAKESRIKAHFKKHKKKYIIGASLVGVGVGGYYLGKYVGGNYNSKDLSIGNVVGKGITIKQIDNSVNTVIQSIGRNVHPGKVIFCNENRKVYRSQNEAAKDLKIPASLIASHLRGEKKDAKGYTFTHLGDAVESQL